MSTYFAPPQESDDLSRAVLRSIQADHFGRDDDPHADDESAYALEQVSLAAQALTTAVDSLPSDEQPVNWRKLDDEFDDEAVHTWFGLSYSSYEVLPRVLMQSMPAEWQRGMVRLLEQMHDAFAHIEQPDCYDVRPATEVEASSLTEAQLLETGVTRDREGDEEDGDYVYHDADGNELESWTRVLVPVANPLPPYSRGRTRIPLRADTGSEQVAS